MIKVWKLLSISIVAAVCLGLLLVPGLLSHSGNTVYLKIEPATTNVGKGQNFTLNVTVPITAGETVAGGEVHIDFNSAYFNVTNVTPGNGPNMVLKNVWDNSTGTVDYVCGLGIGQPNVTSNFTLCTIQCKAHQLGGVTPANFVYDTGATPPRLTQIKSPPPIVDYLGYGTWTTVTNGTVIIGPTFNLTVTSIGCCLITVDGLGTVQANSTGTFVVSVGLVNLTAVNSTCCVFDNWTVDGGAPNTTNPLIINGTANSSYIANATSSVPQYNLTMAVIGSGTTTPGNNTYNCGDLVPINATADLGWWFVDWTGDVSTVADVNSANTTINMTGNYSITANFVQWYTLTMAVTGNGNTTPAEGDHDYANGTDVDINATPDSGWHFVNWTTTGNISEIDDPAAASTFVTVDQNKTVTANFAINVYNLTINSTAGGNVTTPGEGTYGPYDHGTVVPLIATPDAGYAFLGWSGNVSTIADVNSSTTSITMYGNYSIMAHFGSHDFLAGPLSLTFTTVEGENPPSQTLEICNTGNGTLNWSLTDNVGWLSESPTSGSLAEDECEDVVVSVNVAGMKAGDYSATITITGSPEQEVPVSLHIESAMPDMLVLPAALSASALSISPQQVQPGQDVTISINVANTGGATGSYNAVLYINSVVEDSQSVSLAAGASKNVIFTVSRSQAGVYDVSLAGQSGQFEVVGGGGWFGGGGLGTGGIIAIVVVVIILIGAVVFILRGTTKPE